MYFIGCPFETQWSMNDSIKLGGKGLCLVFSDIICYAKRISCTVTLSDYALIITFPLYPAATIIKK